MDTLGLLPPVIAVLGVMMIVVSFVAKQNAGVLLVIGIVALIIGVILMFMQVRYDKNKYGKEEK